MLFSTLGVTLIVEGEGGGVLLGTPTSGGSLGCGLRPGGRMRTRERGFIGA